MSNTTDFHHFLDLSLGLYTWKVTEGSITMFTKFLSDDAGAVTIDWVALTAGILLLGIMVVYAIFNNGVSSLVSNVNSTLTGVSTGVSIGTIVNQN